VSDNDEPIVRNFLGSSSINICNNEVIHFNVIKPKTDLNMKIIAYSLVVAVCLSACGNDTTNTSDSLMPSASEVSSKKRTENAISQSLPSLIVFPSDGMLKRLGFLKEVSNQGVVSYDRQYQQAFVNSESMKFAVAVLEEEFAKVGFPLEDLEQVLKQIASNTAMDEMTGVVNDLRSELLNTARPDYIIELDYDLISDPSSRNLNKSLQYSVKVLDAYTNKAVASVSRANVGSDQKSNDAPTLIKQDFPESLTDLKKQITSHYADLLANGVEVTLRVATTIESGIALDNDCGNAEIGEKVVQWMKENTVGQSYKMSKNTSSELFFTNVRIFAKDEENNKYTAYDFAQDLKKAMKSGCGLDVKNKTQSLGDALLIIEGSK